MVLEYNKQDLSINLENKQKYGEVHTPYSLIERMFALLPEDIFSDPSKKWLDPGAGRGYFSLFLLEKLMNGLSNLIPDQIERRNHILKDMIWVVEMNPLHIPTLEKEFQNVISEDYLLNNTLPEFDVIIGNPPFNCGGLKKVPTNAGADKKQDGKTIWSSFIKKSISLLSSNGLLLFIVPSIWMKEDKEKMYFYMTQYKIHNIFTLTNTQMNQIFKGHAQTPSCYFLLEKKCTENSVLLFDHDEKKYVDFPLRPENILPVARVSLVKQMLPLIDKFGNLAYVKKSNLPSKSITFSPEKTKSHPYPNIKTCILKDKIQPELVIEFSNKPCPFYGKKKLVLAHGMYGFPYVDAEGVYGISNRDKYVFILENLEDLRKLGEFLSSDLVFDLFDATRYRMKYLEKYIFSYLPDILKMSDGEREKIPTIKSNKHKYLSLI